MSAPLRSFSISASCAPVSGLGRAAFLAMTVILRAPRPVAGRLACTKQWSRVRPATHRGCSRTPWRRSSRAGNGGRSGRTSAGPSPRSRRRERPARPTATRPTCWSRAGDAPAAIVKIRFDLMDIKLLREVTADGLERWEPVLKVGSPMPAADVERVIEALSCRRPRSPATPTRSSSSSTRWPGRAGWSARSRSTSTGSATPSAAARPRSPTWSRTARPRGPSPSSRRMPPPSSRRCARSASRATSTRTTRAALAALLDGEPERYAVIDVGTNSIKFQVAELGADGRFHAVVDRAEVTRLGQGIDAGGRSSPRRSSGPPSRSRAWPTRPTALGVTRDRRGRHGRAAAAAGTAGRSSTRSRRAPASTSG